MARRSPQKNSLVRNINRRKKAGTSRSKAHSTVSAESYAEMKKGWTGRKSGRSKPGTKSRHTKRA